jgi:hypothetical protein
MKLWTPFVKTYTFSKVNSISFPMRWIYKPKQSITVIMSSVKKCKLSYHLTASEGHPLYNTLIVLTLQKPIYWPLKIITIKGICCITIKWAVSPKFKSKHKTTTRLQRLVITKMWKWMLTQMFCSLMKESLKARFSQKNQINIKLFNRLDCRNWVNGET